MAVIDDKVVAMSFESGKFESGVNSTISALEKLKASLKLPAASKGLEDVGAAAKKIDLSHIGRSVDAISQKLSYFSVAAIAIFTNIAMKAVQAGAQFAKAFTLDPIISGYKEYATNLNAIQTILANTEASGATLKDVNAALNELNRYSDKTIYNFSQMAKNIGTFTAAGVDLNTATGAIKGIANLAALSGSSAEQASTAMYQLSQAIAAGRVSLMDWNSVVNAGMGGTVFQRALAQTAVAMGTIKESSLKLVGPMKNVSIEGKSFRESMQAAPGKQSWLTSEVLTNTLKQFTADMTDAQLAAMGFNQQQIKAIQQTAKTAMHAATEVKTLTSVLDVAKETAGSGWAQTWQIIFGDFGEAKKTFTALSNSINGFINASANARNKVLGDWKALGGRVVLIDAIKTAFHNLGLIIAPIKDAFREIFPSKTGKDLYNATLQFQKFAQALKPSAETVDNLKRTFAGLFAAFDIGKQIISGIFTMFKELFKAVGGGNGGFLEFTGSIGDFIVAIDKALKKGNALHNFFAGLGRILATPVEILSNLAGVIGNLFQGVSFQGFINSLSAVSTVASPLEAVLQALGRAWDSFSNSVKGSIDAKATLEAIGEAISGIGVAIGNAASSINFEIVLDVIKTGFFGALVIMFKQFLGRGSFLNQVTKGFGKGIFSNISGAFGSLNGSMKAMQQNIKAKTLKEIAIAIALLAASVLAISLIKPERLNAALGAMTVMFGELIGAMALLDKIAKTGGFLKLPIIVAGLVGLAVAIDLLTISVIAMSRLSWDELIKGLAGVGGLLGGLAVSVKALSAGSGGLVRASVGIIGIAVAMKILASAMADFGEMSWTELSKGLGSVAASLAILVVATRAMPTGLVTMGAGLVIIAASLKILADAVAKFGAMDWRTMGRGLAGVAGSLVAIAAGMRLMPKSMVVTAAGLALVALSLGKIADAVLKMGGMSIDQIAKGIGTLAASLGVLAIALRVMAGTKTGALALTVAAAGIAILAPALKMMGEMSMKEIAKSLIAMAGAITVIGIAGKLVGSAVPALLGFGAALLMIGGAIALTGAGIFLISAGLSALAVAGPAAVGVLIAALNQFLEAIPKLATNFALGMLSVVEAFAKTAPKFVDATVKIIASLLDAIIRSAPKMAEAFIALLDAGLTVLNERRNEIIQAGINLLLSLLQGLRANIGQITSTVIDIIVTFLQTIANNTGRIVTAGMNILVSLLKGIANNIGKVVSAGFDIIVKFVESIGTNLARVVTAGVGIITKLITGISSSLGKLITAGTDAIINFLKGVSDSGPRIISAAVDAIAKFINAISKNAVKLADEGAKAIINFLNGVADVIEKREPEMLAAGARIGAAIVKGLINGLVAWAPALYNKATEIIDKALGILHKIPIIGSPSKVTIDIGKNMVLGLALGMSKNANNTYSAAIALSNGVIGAFNNTFQTNSPSKVMMQIGQYVGQGFAQGLRGSRDDINSAFQELNSILTKAMVDARETIATEQEKLDKLRKEKKPDMDAIKAAQATIAENEAILARSKASLKVLTQDLKDEKKELIGLSNEFNTVTANLDAAKQKLAQLRQDRADYIKGLKDQYSGLPDIQMTDAEGNLLDPATQLANYMEALGNQSAAVATYKQTLEQLRKLGLDDATYQKLLTEGTADQSFANQLLAGGKTAVQSLNTLDSQLMKVSATLATNAAKNLKQAGIDAAEGLVKGLQSKHDAIRREMEEIAREMLAALRKELRSKSPSQEFADIGKDSILGLANGFSNSSGILVKSIQSTARDALNVMKKSMSNLSTWIFGDLNPKPVIKPILDLTQVRSQSRVLSGLMTVSPISAAASYGAASRISAEQIRLQADEITPVSGGTSVKFEQNNYSPVALTDIEIYRQTKNQLSQIKSVLAVT